MRITTFSIDAGSWRDRAYYIQPGSSATASIEKLARTHVLQKLKHICDIDKALNMENIDSYLGINV